MFLGTIADSQTAASWLRKLTEINGGPATKRGTKRLTPNHGEKGKKTAKNRPESAFGWVLIGWALERSLNYFKGL